jgi:hypothetical protein
VLSVRKVLCRTTAGFAASRNNGRDIISNDSLINYLRHLGGVLIEDVAIPSPVPACSVSGVAERHAADAVPVTRKILGLCHR